MYQTVFSKFVPPKYLGDVPMSRKVFSKIFGDSCLQELFDDVSDVFQASVPEILRRLGGYMSISYRGWTFLVTKSSRMGRHRAFLRALGYDGFVVFSWDDLSSQDVNEEALRRAISREIALLNASGKVPRR